MEMSNSAAGGGIASQWRQEHQSSFSKCRLAPSPKLCFSNKNNQQAALKCKRSQQLVHCESSKSKRGSSLPAKVTNNIIAHAVDAVSIVPLHGHLFMKVSNGKEFEVDQLNPTNDRLYTAKKAITLQVLHDSGTVYVPIVVDENVYEEARKEGDGEMGELCGLELPPGDKEKLEQMAEAFDNRIRNFVDQVHMIEITKRVNDTYYAYIVFDQGGSTQRVNVQPIDAILFALRCKEFKTIMIMVNKELVESDGVYRSVRIGEISSSHRPNDDRQTKGPDPISEEFMLFKNMLIAVREERYSDAARWRDRVTYCISLAEYIDHLLSSQYIA